ncbi:transcriptional repressor [Patescibacteria group bacterium]|nr:transcriptional repressor [Patescibacteria group bacterium]
MRRRTSERDAILRVLQEAERPLTPAGVSDSVGRTAHVATVYRALDDLVDTGLVRKVALGGRATYYELARSHHHHIICTRCGDIEDIHEEPKKLDGNALKQSKKFSTITSHALEFFGVCKNCV